MRLTMTAIALAMAGMTVPATAASAAVQEEAERPAPEFSNNDRRALSALQDAIGGGDAAAIQEALTNAEANVDTAEGRFTLGQLQLRYGLDTEQPQVMEAAVDKMASALGSTVQGSAASVGEIYRQLGSMRYGEDDYAGSIRLMDKALGLVPTDSQAMVLKAEAYAGMGDLDQAIPAYIQAINTKKASGEAVDENWYKRAIIEASDGSRPELALLSRMWVTEFPTDENWQAILGFYHNSRDHSDDVYLELFRLRRAVNALSRNADYADYAQLLLLDNNPGEALSVLQQGQQAGMIDESTMRHGELLKLARDGEAESERETLDADAEAAKGRDNGIAAYNIGNLYYGYGDYAKAAEMFAVAAEKGGVDADRNQLRLGMALARSGQAEAAKVELGKVSGQYAPLAQYWMLFTETRG